LIAKLNLASQPFRNRTLPWTVAVAVALASLVALFFIVSESRQTGAQADRAESDLRSLRQENAVLKAQAAEVKQSVPPEQLKVLEAAHLLVDRKIFSWSKLLADLESSLPSSVRVSRIGVREVSRSSGLRLAELDLTVVGRTPIDVTGMISEMNRGGIFSAVPASEVPRQGGKGGDGGIEWTLRVTYMQRAGDAAPGDNAASESANVAAASAARPASDETQQ
jgi:Tfp pilus assembly protein PilN